MAIFISVDISMRSESFTAAEASVIPKTSSFTSTMMVICRPALGKAYTSYHFAVETFKDNLAITEQPDDPYIQRQARINRLTITKGSCCGSRA